MIRSPASSPAIPPSAVLGLSELHSQASRLATRLALSTALVLPAAFGASVMLSTSDALAACSPAAANGVSIVCEGIDTAGVGTGTENNVDVTVLSGASVTVAAGDAIDLGNNATITNFGTVQGLSDGISGGGNINSLINSETIQGINRNGIFADSNIGILTNSGTIQGGNRGISAEDITSLTNSGTIQGGTEGIFAQNIASLINSDTIQGDNHGIFSTADIESLTNFGTIRGISGIGIFSATGIESLTNSGTIQGGNAGINSGGTIASLINSNTIQGGNQGIAVTAITTLINSGTIQGGTAGISASTITKLINSGTIASLTQDGINAAIITSLINSGTIRGSTVGVTAPTITSLTNSGTIQGGLFAILENGAANTQLTLNAGSILIGRVDLGGGVNTLNIGEGLSLNSTFDDPDGFSTLPVIGTTNGLLVAILDDTSGTPDTRQVVAVDPSAFASFDDALAALTSGFGGAVQSRQSALRSDPALGFASRFAAADETSLAAFSDLDLTDTPHLNPNRFWVEGFGSFRQGESDRVGGDFDSLTGGLVAGVDVPLDAITSLGVMAGFAASTSENEIDTQQTDATSYFGGIYASTQAGGIFWDASLTLGYTDYQAERITANNLVANGLETASADFGGWFINPQVTMTREAGNPLAGTGIGSFMATSTLEQSLTLSYAGLFMGGYTETGTTNPLTLDDRSVHIASARAALALPFERIEADGALTTLRLIGGVEARTQFGDDSVSGTLLGQSVSATLDDDDFTAGAFVGLAGEYQTTTGLTAYANAEALLETDKAYQISANAGLRIAF